MARFWWLLSLRGKKLSPRPRHHSRFLPYRPRQGTVRRNKAQLLLKVGLATVACGGSKSNATWRDSNRRARLSDAAKLLAMTAIDLLHGGAAPAKEILAQFSPAMTKEGYLEFQRNLFRTERFAYME